MKQLLILFLFLLPCLAWAQYPSNGNQKITLGEQSTADGLIFRGVAATDTVRKPSIDTMAYMVLDTTTNIMWHYKKATSNAWLRLNLLPSDTASMLTNYWRSGRFSGTLPVANGGTNATTLTANKVMVGNGTSGVLTPTNLHWDNTNSRLGIGITNPSYNLHLKDANGTQLLIEGTNSTLQSSMYFTNNRSTDFTSYGGFLYGGESQTSSLFGIVRNDKLFLFADGANNLGMIVGTTSNSPLIFGTNNSEKMRIKTDGEVQVLGTTDRGAYNLQVNGTGVWGEGAYVNGSDANIKENIIDLDSSLNIVNNLKPVVFNYINASVNNDTKHLGFIAQDVYQTLENKDYLGSIVRSDGDTLSIAYSNIIPLLTKAIQEQNSLIKALEQRIINLENK